MKNNKNARRLLQKFDLELFKKVKEAKGYIAGGAILSVFTKQKINDYDLYFPTEEDQLKFLESISFVNKCYDWNTGSKRPKIKEQSLNKMILIIQTNNAMTFLYNNQCYQVITAFNMVPDKLFEKFDFTIVMGAFDLNTSEFILHDRFLIDITDHNLCFNVGTEYPVASMIRLLKYQKRGYTISGTEIIKMALRVHSIELNTFADLKYHLQGIDTLFLNELTERFMKDDMKEKEFDFNHFLELLENYVDEINTKFMMDFDEDYENIEN